MYIIAIQMPLIPLLPSLSMFCNIALMMKLNPFTWIRLGVWIAVGKPTTCTTVHVRVIYNQKLIASLFSRHKCSILIFFIAGVLIYFAYGVHHSNENKALTSFSQIISYTDPAAPLAAGGLKETLHNPQPHDVTVTKQDGDAGGWSDASHVTSDHVYDNENCCESDSH